MKDLLRHARRVQAVIAVVALGLSPALRAAEVRAFGLDQLVKTQKAVAQDYKSKISILQAEQRHLVKFREDLLRRHSEDCQPPWRLEEDAELKVRCDEMEDDARELGAQILETTGRMVTQHGELAAAQASAFREVADALGRMRASEVPRELPASVFQQAVPVDAALVDSVLTDDPSYAGLRAAAEAVRGQIEEMNRILAETLGSVGMTSVADARQSFLTAAWQAEVMTPVYRNFGEAYDELAKLVRVGGLQPSAAPSLPGPIRSPGSLGTARAAAAPVAPPTRPSVTSMRR